MPSPLPEHVEGAGLLVRRWRVDDAEAMHRLVAESAEHLRPWMTWVDQEPDTVEGRRAFLAEAEATWRDGGPVMLAVVEDGHHAGGASLHPHDGGVVEIGYWLHPAFLGRGIATRAARLLTDAALAHPGTVAVEICHDVANERSGEVPRRLGYRLVGERPNPVPASADTGTDRVWRLSRAASTGRTPRSG